MQAFIADNPQGKYGVHRYSPDEFFISPEDVRARHVALEFDGINLISSHG